MIQKIYVASKTKHAPIWLRLRQMGAPIISTWIDEAGPGQTVNFTDLWMRCIIEASSCDILVIYSEPGDCLRGALIEMGCALSHNRPVRIVGHNDAFKSVQAHPLVSFYQSLEEALSLPCLGAGHQAKKIKDSRWISISRQVETKIRKIIRTRLPKQKQPIRPATEQLSFPARTEDIGVWCICPLKLGFTCPSCNANATKRKHG